MQSEAQVGFASIAVNCFCEGLASKTVKPKGQLCLSLEADYAGSACFWPCVCLPKYHVLSPAQGVHALGREKGNVQGLGFRQHYQSDNGSCRPLFLTPKNEAGVRKLVCTTLRPTLLPHTDLYDLPGIVQFVASYFAYEPLANPVHYPEYLPSPSSVISWQVIWHFN